MQTEQIKTWTGSFGRDYTERNRFADDAEFNRLYVERYGRSRDEINEDWLTAVPREARILEVGANIGNQLRALSRIGFRHLYGIEIQRFCVEEAKRLVPAADVVEASAVDIPFKDGWFDLVFTNNVLIHIAPDDIGGVFDEMHRVTGRWIWGFEYFAPQFTQIPYRGKDDLLWKADYAALFRERFPTLESEREELVNCLDEPGNRDKLYLLSKVS